MFGEKFIASLIDKAIRYPKAATFIVCVLVIGFLGMTVKTLFIRNEVLVNTDNSEKRIRISELEKRNATLQTAIDSLNVLVGEVRAEGLRNEIAIRKEGQADLAAFNKKLQSEKDELVRSFTSLRNTAVQTKNITEAIKKQSNEN